MGFFLAYILSILQSRAEILVPLLVAAFAVGGMAAERSGFLALTGGLRGRALRLRVKLNREGRSIGRRLWRGIIALLMILAPALFLGWAVGRHASPVAFLLLFMVLGTGFRSTLQLVVWRQAKAGNLPLELPGEAFLFADSHAVLRYLIVQRAEAFATQVVGVSFWYLVGGFPLAFAYVALAEVTPLFAVPVFGWAAMGLFRLVHCIPRLLTLLLFGLAALFVPRARPLAVLRAQPFYAAVARLVGVSLGGVMPDGTRPWAGEGPARVTAADFGRWLLLLVAATVLLVLACAAPAIYKLLNL